MELCFIHKCQAPKVIWIEIAEMQARDLIPRFQALWLQLKLYVVTLYTYNKMGHADELCWALGGC
jgi:hypothetical protein